MAKFPTMQEMAKNVAERALDECKYKGKTIRQWVTMLCKGDCVEVVRCKDCKHKFVEYDGTFTCNIFSNCYGLPYRINLDDFCSHGERRE